ncbi:VanZ family protein [Bacillus salitolerans]|uniref:VanZ family protein n=1 Tax=Bacillus salitolerans TaxID=1437434 RepID=A0ABW4LQC9_9BACI
MTIFIRKIMVGCFCINFIILMYLLFLSSYRQSVYGTLAYNVIPFKSISDYIMHFNGFGWRLLTDNFFGNIFAFVPFGFFIAYFIEKQFLKVVGLSFFFSFAIEVTQVLIRAGAFDVDDIVLNTTGGVIGFLIFSSISRLLTDWKVKHEYRRKTY